MTRMDLYEAAELACVDCGEVLPVGLQRVAALRCHDCADCFEVRDILRVHEVDARAHGWTFEAVA